MRTLLSLSIVATLATLAACAAPPPDHSMHGDQAAAGPASCDAHMGAMRAMHDKMMAAKTPQEREALRAEHMKTMPPDAMGRCQAMMGRGMPASAPATK